ncbi:sulfatase [Bryobacterales bacterium F-183]|nr:sulfatase [Bryobacterales bacterium F-183]
MSPNRRRFLWEAGGGLAGIALSQMMASAATSSERKPGPHFAPKAKNIIMIFLPGGISAIDTFDYKPELEKHHGKATTGANTITPFFGKPGTLMKSPWTFRPRGKSGKYVSELVPNLAELTDDLTFLHSMVARSNAHGPALFQMSTGFIFQGFPSIGSWISYGLGSENQNLPSFVVLPDRRGLPPCGVANWGNGFLPAAHQGVIFGDQKEPIADIKPPASVTAQAQTASYDLLTQLNEDHLKLNPGEDALVARIKSYEMAARMQISAPEVTDIRGESEATREMYGLNDPITRDYGYNCLLARRLVEKGVRCIQMYNGGHFGAPRVNWDGHEDLRANHSKMAAVLDKPTAALIRDLKQRGMLKDTLVVFTTEFGRLPISEGLGEGGRDHNPEGYTSFFVGAGVKPGISYGATDELGYKAAENPVTVYDFHATILHLLGLDHKDLNWYHNGIRRRLTDVHGHVIQPVLA